MSKLRTFSTCTGRFARGCRSEMMYDAYLNVRAEMEIDVEELTKRHGSKLSLREWAPFPETLGVKPVIYVP
jgi:hypothetical protein